MRLSIEKLSDPGHRELWVFQYELYQGLRLTSYHIQDRATPRHKWRDEAKWECMDERRYNSKLERPEKIPDDVIKQAMDWVCEGVRASSVYIGWYNEKSEVTWTDPKE